MGYCRKRPVILSIILFFIISAGVSLLLLPFSAPHNVQAEGASFSASWENRPYMAGEQVKIRLSLSGLPADGQIAGSISLSLSGLENAMLVSNESILETAASTTVFRISVSEGAYANVGASGVWEIGEITVTVSASAAESRFSAEAVLSDSAGNPIAVVPASYTVVRSAETPTPTATPAQTPVPSDGATQTPPDGETPDASSLSPSPSAETPEITATPEPTVPPATMTEIETASPSEEPMGSGAVSSQTPEGSPGIFHTQQPGQTPGAGPDDSEARTISVGAVIFWSIVSLVGGIWIGIAIGAFIWKKKSVFMTAAEKKIIGRF